MSSNTNTSIIIFSIHTCIRVQYNKYHAKNLYKIKFSYLCTPIDKTTQKISYKTTFSFLCTPIDT